MAVHKGSEAERVGMALKEKGFYLRRKLVTSDMFTPVFNAGNVFFEIDEQPMSWRKSFSHSRVGSTVRGLIS